MPRPAWFADVFGAPETDDYHTNQGLFALDGHSLVVPTSRYGPFYIGPFDTPSLGELRQQAASMAMPGGGKGGLTFEHVVTSTGVQTMIADAQNADQVFQAASQFNCLEMMGPNVSPRAGIAIYANDPTQGPKCALACPAGTAFRNYLYNGIGQGDTQIDCLAGVGRVVGNDEARGAPKYWDMQNGYAMPANSQAMRALGERLRHESGLSTRAQEALQVGVHWDTVVRPPNTHRVCQVYASAVPVSYARSTGTAPDDWEEFARLVLRAAYDATLLVGRVKAAQAGKRVTVFLTMLGGGAFGNRDAWVIDGIVNALERHRDAPIDVKLVHYGSMQGEYAKIPSI